MVTRRSRNYKENTPMTTFGKFVLPLTVIMAFALLFFSVKLFFFNPNDSVIIDGNHETVENNGGTAVKKPDTAAPVKVTQPVKTAVKPVSDIQIAKPVDDAQKKVAVKPQPQPQPVKVKESVKPQPVKVKEPVKAQPAKVTEPVKTQPSKTKEPAKTPPQDTAIKAAGVRWDVQIGGFTSVENAVHLVEKARTQGYKAYISETKREESPFYRVRVKGVENKADAQKLSAKLEEQGYPVYLVEVKPQEK